MKAILHSLVVAGAIVAALVTAATAAAAPSSTSFAIVGYEYAFTQTIGHFAGVGTGNASDTGAWNTRVEHDPLGSTPTYVDGGSFQMITRGANGSIDEVTGTFTHHGGTITQINPGANCTNQQYLVTGALQDVSTSTTSAGSGQFAATLTHYRVSLFGRCLIYKARVAGTVSLTY